MKDTSFEDCSIFTCFNNNLFCIYFLFPANYHRLQALHQVQNFALILQTNFNEPPIFIALVPAIKKSLISVELLKKVSNLFNINNK